jgi:hypothetical protein
MRKPQTRGNGYAVEKQDVNAEIVDDAPDYFSNVILCSRRFLELLDVAAELGREVDI